ncbi:hypothetical protein BEP68_16305 [Microbacterium sp. 4-7]|nr:hypothetical protein NS234_07105 [Microbacterium oxydans]MBC6496386.1 hypothetical protein [Microbacterium sp. 4-7]
MIPVAAMPAVTLVAIVATVPGAFVRCSRFGAHRRVVVLRCGGRRVVVVRGVIGVFVVLAHRGLLAQVRPG